MKWLVSFLIFSGCSGSIVYHGKMPTDPQKIKAAINSLEISIVELDEQLEDEITQRGIAKELYESAEGWWAKENARTDYNKAKNDVKHTRFIITSYKNRLTRLKTEQQKNE